MQFYEMEMPRLCTAAADWLSCVLLLQFLKPRVAGWKKAALYTGALVLLCVYLAVTDGYDGWLFNLLYGISVMMMLGFLWLASCARPGQLIFACARSVINGGFAASLVWQLYAYFAQDLVILQGLFGLVCFMAAGFALVFGILYALERYIRAANTAPFDPGMQSALLAAGMALAVYILSSISYMSVDTPFSVSGIAAINSSRTVVYFAGVMLLAAYQAQIQDLAGRQEAEALRNMLQLQEENSRVRQESIDLINQKYHDLKHQIAVLRSESDEDRRRMLDEMEEEIRIYETQSDTGNKVLDTMLTTKSLVCRSKGIQMTCVADGTVLSNMELVDINSLLGNALDNAIEATDRIAEPERKLIHLSIARQRGFVTIRVENCCDELPKMENGLPLTTKEDNRYHGFGVRSIRATAEKYGGSASFRAREGWFELRIMIPAQQCE